MKNASFLRVAAILLVVSASASVGFAQTTAFTFQGRLTDTSVPASGTYQMQFSLYDALSGGTQIGSTITNNSVAVSGGVFTVTLDFSVPAAFDGGSRFIQIAVKKPADPTFTPLTPRQPVTSSPYSIKSLNSGTADNSLMLGGQPPASYGTSAQIAALQSQIASQQSLIVQLQAQLEAATSGMHIWSRRAGGTSGDVPAAIAPDSDGNIILTGTFNGTVDFGVGSMTSAGASDIFVVKYAGASGEVLWSRRFGGTTADSSRDVAIDSAGNIFLTGWFNSPTIDFGGGPLTNAGGSDIFLAKLSTINGNHLWARRFGGSGFDEGSSLAVSSSDDVYVGGSFNGTVDFLGLPLTSAGGYDIFVAKYSGTSSSHIWSRRFGNTSNDWGQSVAVDNAGNALIAGMYNGPSLSFGGTALLNEGGSDAYVAKLTNADGSPIWARNLGGNSTDEQRGLAVDANNAVYVAGYFNSLTIDLGGGTISGLGADIFLAKYDATGAHHWSKGIGTTGTEFVEGLALDSNGNPVLAGKFFPSTNLGGVFMETMGNTDLFAAKYSSATGTHQWSKRFGGTNSDEAFCVAVDPAGDVYVAGAFFSTTIDFGGGPLTNAGLQDIFIAKLRR